MKNFLTWISIATCSAFVCVPVWPWPLWPGEVCMLGADQLLGAEETWLAPRLFIFGRHSTQKQTISSWHMEDTSIMPAVPTSGSTVLNQNLLASSCLICSEKLQLDCFYFFHHTHGWQGPMNRIQVLQSSPPWIYMKNSPRGGQEKAAEVPSHSYRWPLSLGSHCQSLGFVVKLPSPSCMWHQKLLTYL